MLPQGIVQVADSLLLERHLGLQLNQLCLQALYVLLFAQSTPSPKTHSGVKAGYYSLHPGDMDDSVSRRDKPASRPVYSTESGRLCPQCQRAVAACVCSKDRPAYSGDGIVRIQRQTKGRNGKAVSVITGLPLPETELKALAKALKKRCGVGGSCRNGTIEVQGEQRELLKSELEKRGYTVKIAGG